MCTYKSHTLSFYAPQCARAHTNIEHALIQTQIYNVRLIDMIFYNLR